MYVRMYALINEANPLDLILTIYIDNILKIGIDY